MVGEIDCEVTMNDVDKLHRVGPVKGDKQDCVVRFKSHSAKENFYLKRKSGPRRHIKIGPSLTPSRRELLNDAQYVVEDYIEKNIGSNLPEFVYADMHGNLKVKMTHNLGRTSFFKFTSIQDLSHIIDKCQTPKASGDYNNYMYSSWET